MHEGAFNSAVASAHDSLDSMLGEARRVAKEVDGVEVRTEQRITIEAGTSHAKWNNSVSEYIGDEDNPIDD